MKVQTGYLYYIKDEFFDKINDNGNVTVDSIKKRGRYFLLSILSK